MNVRRAYRSWHLRRQARIASRVCRRIDRAMAQLQFPHWKRKQLWRDVIKSAHIRDEMFNVIAGGRER